MKTIRKTGLVLRQFTEKAPEQGLAELARTLELSSSATFDIVNGLTQIGMLTKVARGRYRLGPLIASLHAVLTDTAPVTDAARAVLDRLVADYGETVHLTQLDHGRLLVLDSRPGRRMLNVAPEALSASLALEDSAAGLMHLAAMSKGARDQYRAEHGHCKALHQDALERLQETGYCAAPLRPTPDIIVTAAQFHNHAGLPAGVISLAIPKSRYTDEARAFRTITIGAAADITKALGAG